MINKVSKCSLTSWVKFFIALMLVTTNIGGCQTFPETPREVLVSVKVSCVPLDFPWERFKTDKEFMELDDYGFVVELWIDRRARISYAEKLEAIAKECQRVRP